LDLSPSSPTRTAICINSPRPRRKARPWRSSHDLRPRPPLLHQQSRSCLIPPRHIEAQVAFKSWGLAQAVLWLCERPLQHLRLTLPRCHLRRIAHLYLLPRPRSGHKSLGRREERLLSSRVDPVLTLHQPRHQQLLLLGRGPLETHQVDAVAPAVIMGDGQRPLSTTTSTTLRRSR
jgi:hypothetical protein